jgi:hypothetical protein
MATARGEGSVSKESTITALCGSITYQAALIQHRWRGGSDQVETLHNVNGLRMLLNRVESLLEQAQDAEVAALMDIGYTRSAALYELNNMRYDGSDVVTA